MVVNPEILEELYIDAGQDRVERAKEYVDLKKVKITKVTYEDINNFEVRSKVIGNGQTYDVYIKVKSAEIQDVSCDCEDYHAHYATCKHILATIIEFNQNSDYIRIFSENHELKQTDVSLLDNYSKRKNNEKYRAFKQLISEFYNSNNNQIEEKSKQIIPHTVKLEPKLIYNTYNKTLKIEF